LIVAGGNFDNLKRKIAKANLDTSHFTGKVWSKGKSIKEWAGYKKNAGRKKVLINERGHKCEKCALTEWLTHPIVLELHHIDGNRLNNEKTNLELLCCNCHAITDNWRNKKRNANVLELVDKTDLKSVVRKGMRVRSPPFVPFYILFNSGVEIAEGLETARRRRD